MIFQMPDGLVDTPCDKNADIWGAAKVL